MIDLAPGEWRRLFENLLFPFILIFHLLISDLPTVTIPQSYSVDFGSSITIECQITATPGVTSVSWSRIINGQTTTITISNNNKFSGGTVSNPSLTITGADNSDEGFYICSASNSVGTGQSQQRFLDVIGSTCKCHL